MKSPIGKRRFSRRRISKGRVLLAGVFMAIFAVIATVGLLRIYPPRPLLPEPKLADSPANAEIENIEIVILSTDENRSYFKSFGGEESVIIQPWQDVCEQFVLDPFDVFF